MWKNRLGWIIGGLLLVGIGAFLLLGRREPLSPEAQIRQVLWRGKAGIEKESVGQVMSVVSRDYRDETFQHSDVVRALMHAFREVDNITISLSQPAIQVAADGQTAKVHFDQVEIVASSQGQARHYSTPVDIELRRERRGWKVTRVTGWVDITE